MHERPLEHPRDDLHVAMRMRLESRPGLDPIVVADQQQSEVSVLRVVVMPKRERVVRVEPTPVGGEPVFAPSHIEICHVAIVRRAHSTASHRTQVHTRRALKRTQVHTRRAWSAPRCTLDGLWGVHNSRGMAL